MTGMQPTKKKMTKKSHERSHDNLPPDLGFETAKELAIKHFSALTFSHFAEDRDWVAVSTTGVDTRVEPATPTREPALAVA